MIPNVIPTAGEITASAEIKEASNVAEPKPSEDKNATDEYNRMTNQGGIAMLVYPKQSMNLEAHNKMQKEIDKLLASKLWGESVAKAKELKLEYGAVMTFNLDYLLLFLKTVKKLKYQYVTLKLNPKTPVCMEARDGDAGVLQYYLAPYVVD